MNKYQEALNAIINKTTEVDEYESIPKSTLCHCADEVEVLQELVNKATPKRPYVGGFNPDAGYPESGFYCCPNCGERIAWFDLNENRDYKINHCFYCGQALDWRVDN